MLLASPDQQSCAQIAAVGDKGVRFMGLDTSMPVLVVDDYQTMVRIIRNLLKQIGFHDVDDASDGAAALARLSERRYGLVISDWNMQPMSGYELLKQIRVNPLTAHLPFIMVTAESKTDNVIAARSAGVSSYIVKPFNALTLRLKVEAVCNQQARSPAQQRSESAA